MAILIFSIKEVFLFFLQPTPALEVINEAIWTRHTQYNRALPSKVSYLVPCNSVQ